MAVRYGRVESGWWPWAKERGLSPVAFMLGPYLMSFDRRNSLGAFRMAPIAMTAELPYTAEEIDAGLNELASAGEPSELHPEPKPFIHRLGDWIVIRDHLRHNKPENINSAKGVVNRLADLPKPVRAIAAHCAVESGGEELGESYPDVFSELKEIDDSFANFREAFAKRSEKVSTPVEPPEIGDRNSETGDRISEASTKPHARVIPPVPHRSRPAQAARVWEHYRTHHPAARVFDPVTRGLVEKRLAEGFTVEELCRAIDGQHANPHNLGENDTGTKYLDLAVSMRKAEKVRHYLASADAHCGSPGSRAPPLRTPLEAKNVEAMRQWVGTEDIET